MSYLSTRNTSTQLLKSSLRVLWQNPKLLGFVLLTFAVSLGFAFLYFGLVVLPPSDRSLFDGERWAELPAAFKAMRGHPTDPHQLMFYGNLYVFYVLSILLTTFLNVANYHEIMRAMSGEPVSLTRGLRFACSRLPSILAWGLFAAVVGMLIQLLAERLGWLGRWVLRLVGVGWSLAAVFVIPVMIREPEPNPLALLRKSAATLKKTWGEAVFGYAGITLGFMVPMVVMLMLAPLLIVRTHPAWSTSTLFVFAGPPVLLLGISCLSSMANSVYRCALYIYATEGIVPEQYTPELMDAAWKIKKS